MLRKFSGNQNIKTNCKKIRNVFLIIFMFELSIQERYKLIKERK